MKIIELRAENIKKLSAVSIRPDGNLVQITGKNGNGKTSVLDALWWGLAGTRNVQVQPIRRGCESAMIKIDLGELKVTRTFALKDDGDFTTNIKVERASGERLSSPQAVLDAILGEMTFDPLAFTRMSGADQFEALKRFVPGVDFEAIAKANKADFETRTTVNRRAKETRAQAEGITLPGGPVPKAVDVAALEAELAEAAGKNGEIERRRARREAAQSDLARLNDEIARITQQRDELKAQLDAAEALPEPIDVADLTTRLSNARAANVVADKAKRKDELLKQAGDLETESKALTKAMEDRDAEKQKAVAKAKMPVEGLGFGDDMVLLRGVPFNQASDAEQLSAAIAIAAAMNPELRIIRVRDGSLLDEEAITRLGEFADAHDMQVWIERVDSSGAIGFVLEDGHLAGESPQAEEHAEEPI